MKKEGFILVGFDDYKLSQLVEKVNSDPSNIKELARLCFEGIPHYRSFSSSSLAEQEAFVKYLDIMKKFTEGI